MTDPFAPPSDRADEQIRRILADPAASYWLRDALRAALKRDPVDAANDAEVLREVLCLRADAGLKAAPERAGAGRERSNE